MFYSGKLLGWQMKHRSMENIEEFKLKMKMEDNVLTLYPMANGKHILKDY